MIEFLRQFRIGGFAVFDFVVSLVGMYLIAPLLSRLLRKAGVDVPKINWVFFALPLGIIVHAFSGQETPMNKMLFDPGGNYLLKISMVILLILSFRGIKRIKKE